MTKVPVLTSLGTLIVGLASLAAPLSTRAADEKGDMILILDASGSMWAKAGGVTRIEAARKTVEDVMQSVPKDRAVGLMAYGHRTAGDCGDIQLIVPATKGQPDRIVNAAKTIVPKGKTPLTASVRMAAESLKYKDAAATVVLVTDGVETCRADPCALAAELEKSGLNFTAHVIGFGLTQSQGQQVACLAQATGGQYLTASNAEELTNALNQTITAAPVAPQPAKAAPAPKPVPLPETGLKLKAVYAEGGEAFGGAGLVWRVQSPTPNARGQYEELKATSDKTPFIEMEPGTYRVEAVAGPVRRAVEVEVLADKPTELTLVLDAGLLKLRALAGQGGEVLQNGVVWYVLESKKSLSGQAKEVTATSAGLPTLTLPAGDYLVRVSYGAARAEMPVSIGPGKLTETDVIVNAGIAAVTSMVGGQKVSDNRGFVMRVLSEPTGLEGTQKEVAATSSPHDQFKLSAGNYVVRARLGWGNAWAEAPITIKPNERTDVSMVFDAGFVTPLLLKANGQPADTSASWFILDAQGQSVGSLSGRRDGIWLKSGNYRMVTTINRKAYDRAFEVVSGQRSEVSVRGP